MGAEARWQLVVGRRTVAQIERPTLTRTPARALSSDGLQRRTSFGTARPHEPARAPAGL